MQRVKLSREVAAILHDSHALVEFCKSNRTDRIEMIMEALVNGYEIKETPEEQAIQWLIKRKCISPGFSEHDIVMAIKSILEKGVNDHE